MAVFPEISFYLLIHWDLHVPWSLTFQLALWEMVRAISQSGAEPQLGADRAAAVHLVHHVVLPGGDRRLPLTGARRTTAVVFRAFVLGHVMIVSSYFTFIACCGRALFRMLLKRTNWNKTARRPATAEELPPAAPSPAA